MAPGLYALGDPDGQSPVLVTCNYKLTFDILRRELEGLSCWVLVVETYGINVWCAAGKKSFNTGEVARQVKNAGLEQVVNHRTLVLPQLAAPGVVGHKIRGLCGFNALFGPVEIRDLPSYLDNKTQAAGDMRRVKFPLGQRLLVALVEVYGARKFMLWALLACMLLAALGPGGFSLQGTVLSGLGAWGVVWTGFISGVFLVPVFLRHLYFRAFAAKGLLAGALTGFVLAVAVPGGFLQGLAATAACMAFTSWFAMHYTGSTTFTSLSGVDREMRRYMPVQGALILVAAGLWLGSGWFGPLAGGA